MGGNKSFMGLIGSSSHPSIIPISASLLRREVLSSALGRGGGGCRLPLSSPLRGSNSRVPRIPTGSGSTPRRLRG